MISRSNIKYNFINGQWQVKQYVKQLSEWQLSGDIDMALSYLNEIKKEFSEPVKLHNQYFIVPDLFSIKSTSKTVSFDKLELEFTEEYESKVIQIWGVRKAADDEILALEKYQKKQKDQQIAFDMATYKRLKKQFEGK